MRDFITVQDYYRNKILNFLSYLKGTVHLQIKNTFHLDCFVHIEYLILVGHQVCSTKVWIIRLGVQYVMLKVTC